jgi:hypothetical protein
LPNQEPITCDAKPVNVPLFWLEEMPVMFTYCE